MQIHKSVIVVFSNLGPENLIRTVIYNYYYKYIGFQVECVARKIHNPRHITFFFLNGSDIEMQLYYK